MTNLGHFSPLRPTGVIRVTWVRTVDHLLFLMMDVLNGHRWPPLLVSHTSASKSQILASSPECHFFLRPIQITSPSIAFVHWAVMYAAAPLALNPPALFPHHLSGSSSCQKACALLRRRTDQRFEASEGLITTLRGFIYSILH